MRKNRDLITGATYHVISRTNKRELAFEQPTARHVALLFLREAKEKFGFQLFNFCIMPTHIHLLIAPKGGDSLSTIMCWIKTQTSKAWNGIYHSSDHLWGHRFFARPISGIQDYYTVMNYIDQNPVKDGLVENIGDWEDSGAYHIRENTHFLVDFDNFTIYNTLPAIVGNYQR